MAKKLNHVGIRFDDAERAALECAAAEAGLTVSAYIRSVACGNAGCAELVAPAEPVEAHPVQPEPEPEPEQGASGLTVHHVDDLGNDTLRTV